MIAEFTYTQVDDTYAKRAADYPGGHAVVDGETTDSVRLVNTPSLHPASGPARGDRPILCPHSLANLANFGMLPLEFSDPADYDRLSHDDVLQFSGLREAIQQGNTVIAELQGNELKLEHRLCARQLEMILAGGRIPQRTAQDTTAETATTTEPREEAKPTQPEG